MDRLTLLRFLLVFVFEVFLLQESLDEQGPGFHWVTITLLTLTTGKDSLSDLFFHPLSFLSKSWSFRSTDSITLWVTHYKSSCWRSPREHFAVSELLQWLLLQPVQEVPGRTQVWLGEHLSAGLAFDWIGRDETSTTVYQRLAALRLSITWTCWGRWATRQTRSSDRCLAAAILGTIPWLRRVRNTISYTAVFGPDRKPFSSPRSPESSTFGRRLARAEAGSGKSRFKKVLQIWKQMWFAENKTNEILNSTLFHRTHSCRYKIPFLRSYHQLHCCFQPAGTLPLSGQIHFPAEEFGRNSSGKEPWIIRSAITSQK